MNSTLPTHLTIALILLGATKQVLAADPLARAGKVEVSFEEARGLVETLPAAEQAAAGSGPCRSRIPEHADRRFRSKPITDSGASRSLNA
ncbi:MAG TPA: hypothetical protein VEB43_11050 [Anaeromyxobacter sp.]|nr:hypothetical protein [Anaeromyxobacter sp.]